jgi:VanZ family protein
LTPFTGSPVRAACLVGALLWAALLYYLSDQPAVVEIQAFEYQDKVLHLFAYGVLGMLIMGALRAGSNGYRVSQLLLVTVLAGLYGLLDEYHQSFVPGRDPALGDVVADVAGGLLGALLVYMLARRSTRE